MAENTTPKKYLSLDGLTEYDSLIKDYTKAELDKKADLDANGKVPSSQLPSYVDDVIEGTYVSSTSFKDASSTDIAGETGKIYVDTATNKTYRWSGSAFVEISASLALGETSSTAYRGDRGKIAYDHSQAAHAPSDAQKNQNAFSNIAVSGQTTVAADTATDTLTLVAGSNITITTDAANDKVTIAATDTVYSHPNSHPASMITGLATVATSGSYNDLSNKPTIPAAYSHPSSHPASMITGLATVATSGSYNDLSNKPTIPAAVTVDTALSSTSTNPVQNKVVNTALDGKVPTTRTVNGKALSADITLAASDVGAFSTSGGTVAGNIDVTTGSGGVIIRPASIQFYSSANGKVTGLATPTNNTDAANKKYVDDKYTYSTTDLTAGTSTLETGKIYLVYE